MPAPPAYAVIYSGLVRLELHRLGERAMQSHRGDEFASVLRTIDHRLRSNPSELGEVSYHLRLIGIDVRRVATPFFYLGFGVDEARRVVYVVDCVGSSPLD